MRVALVFAVVVALTASTYCQSGPYKRNLADIRYKFTSCGAVGRKGPTFLRCHQNYTVINSPLVTQNLLFNVEEKEILGAQGFRLPSNGLYNITIAAARGGRGICNPLRGYGYVTTAQVELSVEYELLIFVGQRGTGPCDVIPDSEDAHDLLEVCREPPINITDVDKCNETWYNFTRGFSDHEYDVYKVFGGGAGGGGSMVRARKKGTNVLDQFPVVLVGGGGGTASVLDNDVFKDIVILKTDIENASTYQEFVNAAAETHATNYGTVGAQGCRNASSNNVAGVGGGYCLNLRNSKIDMDGQAIRRGGIGGSDCAQLFIDAGRNIPYSGVFGGFGGGGGACGGGGGGGGYTGGAILAVGETIPGEGGYSYVGDHVTIVSQMLHRNDSEPDGFVEIIPAKCGCTHQCFLNLTEDQYECLCPDGAALAPDMNDCFKATGISIKQGPLLSLSQSEFYYRFIELHNSAFIYSIDVYIQNNTKMCVLFWLGDESEIVLITDVVRYTGRINTLATIQGSTLPVDIVPASVLNSSVLVTGAMLLGTGNCSIANDTIKMNTSTRTPSTHAITIAEFHDGNKSAVEQKAIALASTLFKQSNTPDPEAGESSQNIAGIGIALFVVAFTVAVLVVIAIGYLIYRHRRSWPWSSNYTVLKSSCKHSKFKDSLVLNAAYSKFSTTTGTPFRPLIDQIDHRCEIFVHSSENANYATFSPIESSIEPLHGVSSPGHDFFEFNVQRKNSLISGSEWNYPRGDLMYMRELGEGQFGKVLLMKAKNIAGYSGQIPVAVKTLTSRDPDVIKKFYEEAELMKKFSHPNVISLLGFIQEEKDEDSAPLMVLEYMQYGDLGSFLKSHGPVDGKPSLIGEENFRAFATDVAKGLEFLSSMKYVHRDIATRNCLVGTGLHIKIADFGLARAIHNKDYYKVDGAAVLPIRWMAPESLLFGVFSAASDVWSFGVLLWEIVTYGKTPLGDTSVEDIINAAQNSALSLCHARPPNCSDYLYQVMSECLKHNCEDRPGFKDIVSYLSTDHEFPFEDQYAQYYSAHLLASSLRPWDDASHLCV